ncbi:NmrA/HSCARG family protein [Burkholderia cenocepacia]|uniref:SDR family oxidoreductase n=1 Tax=Burkholderia cepacia complex TaxID=87882 RepID=UPI000F583D4C|nr:MULTISPECIES: NmrA/HSCARG family protein [Burkholderia cepacia complex]ELW9447504.1 NmrA/HSCARG family protein [Burkholderia cenocepacia]MBR8484354.1 NmrA/HSCARG family protein [Burkholderia cenocepacia]MBR8510248.1 NmrA/HSCARG family protein [Burkholderia cenocepacia]MDN7468496.1 NmrA/HSCARG family protein [Burkholderia orbicola]MDN7501429.1 NmrA/HSCARG family protein [Burkholderia orbicola]
MTILVTGATGRIGRQLVRQLVDRGADVRVLVRDPAKADFPAAVTVAQGDMLDVDALRAAFSGVRTLFLLNGVAGDEFTQALIALNLAREAGIERVVYLSVLHADRFVNVPHFAVKFGAERMIEQMGFSATILRPAYFMDNDATVKDVIVGHGVYPMPIGGKGIAMIDARDIAEVAALELIRRHDAPGKLPVETLNLVGPDTLTGPQLASIWSDTLGRPVAYGGDDPTPFEDNFAKFMPKWMAYEMRLMAERFVSDGMVPEAGDVERLTAILGRPLRTYRDFVAALVR